MINGDAPDRRKFASYKTWWTKRSKLQKQLTIGGLIAAAALLLLLIILLSVGGAKECTSSGCARASMELLLKYVDVKADPCTDFYRFACGNFLKSTNLEDRGWRSVRDAVSEKIPTQIRNMLADPVRMTDPIAFNSAKKLYAACMNETAVEAEGLHKLKEIFSRIGGWPTALGNKWRGDAFDWKDAVRKLRQIGINFDFFIIVVVERDKNRPDRYILSLKDPSFGSSQISATVKSLYLQYMVDLAVLVGAERKRARKEQEEVLQLLLKLAKISEDAAAANGSNLYNPHSLSELQYEFPDIPWLEYINGVVAPAARITHDDDISVSEPWYLKGLLKLLKRTDKRIIANYMCWHILQHLIYYLPPKILSRAYEYKESVNGKKVNASRWNMCVDAVETGFSTVISAAYIKKYLDEETRQRAISMIRNIKYRFKENLHKLDWLDGKTKDIASEILLSSVEEIPDYNTFIRDNLLYDKVEILEDKLLTSVLNLDYVTTNIQYGKLRDRFRENFFQDADSVTGLKIVYSPKENVLRIPVGLFREVFYQKDRPEYMNYGALGTVIAHEMYHIITQAEYRGLQGELRSWWSSQSLLNYEAKMQCLSRQYEELIDRSVQSRPGIFKVNASNIRDEDMGDLTGMKVAYDSYIAWVEENGVEPRLSGLNYSPNQLFWISSAIHHCAKFSNHTFQRHIANYYQRIGEVRVNGALQNLDEFAEDFACPLGSNMNPNSKCTIW